MQTKLKHVGIYLLIFCVGIAVGSFISRQAVQIRAPLKDFSSVEELKSWLSEDQTDKTFLEPGGESILCGERAKMLVLSAEESNYKLSMEVLTKEEYDKYYLSSEKTVSTPVDYRSWRGDWPELEKGGGHAICAAAIKDQLYLIEPITEDVWLYGRMLY